MAIDTETGALINEEDIDKWEIFKKANLGTVATKKPAKGTAKFPDGTTVNL